MRRTTWWSGGGRRVNEGDAFRSFCSHIIICLFTSWTVLSPIFFHLLCDNAAEEIQENVKAAGHGSWNSNITCPWETTAQGSPFINPDYMYWSDRTRRIPSWMGSADWKHTGCWCSRRGSWSVQTDADKPLLTRRNQSAISRQTRSTASHADLYYEVNNLF